MKLFDSHCHLDDIAYEADIHEVIDRMHAAGVNAAMNIGTTIGRCIKGVTIAESTPGIYASVGIHPHDAKECDEYTLRRLMDLSNSPSVLAWGEIGLDFNRMYSPRDVQEKWFVRQLEISGSMNFPVVIHERDTNGRLLEILKAHFGNGLNGVVHCFSGTKDELFQYLDLGLCIGITGIVTLKGRGELLRELVPLMPEDRILIETDAPYLTPTPQRNQTSRNEPAFVRSVLSKLADIRNEDPEELAEELWSNTCNLYGVGDRSSYIAEAGSDSCRSESKDGK
jgi:TatD DNase family protein